MLRSSPYGCIRQSCGMASGRFSAEFGRRHLVHTCIGSPFPGGVPEPGQQLGGDSPCQLRHPREQRRRRSRNSLHISMLLYFCQYTTCRLVAREFSTAYAAHVSCRFEVSAWRRCARRRKRNWCRGPHRYIVYGTHAASLRPDTAMREVFERLTRGSSVGVADDGIS
jgi:hypothetical protein